MSGRVLHTGQVVIDLALRLDAMPAPGGDGFAEDGGIHVGGGFNVLLASRQLGVETVFCGTLGTGTFSDSARAGLDRIGVRHAGVTRPEDIGYCVAITDASAERTFISTRGAETRDPVDAFDALSPRQEDVIYISGYSLASPENEAALLRLVGRLGGPVCRVLLDVSPMVGTASLDTLEAMRTLAPLWSMNEREALLLGERLDVDGSTPEELCAGLSARLGETLVRAGDAGAWYSLGAEPEHIDSITVEAIDTNGAGDAHSGVLCAALARGEDLPTALLWANVAGALSTTRRGPATCPDEREIIQALRRLP